MSKKALTVLGLSGVLALGACMTSFAQSDGTINYSDTFTKGEEVGAYVEDVYSSAAVNVFTNKNFTLSIDKDNFFKNHFTNLNIENYNVHSYVWIAFINENGILEPITKNPYTELNVDIKEVSSGVYSLEGLDIKENVIYAAMADVSGDIKPSTYHGSGNAGGGAFSGVEPSYFKIVSSNTANTNSTTANTTTNTSNNSDGSSVYYYWEHNNIGWWVQCSDGSYLRDQWYLSPASGLYFYLGSDGYMLTNTRTPDGYYVDSEGVWIQ